MDKDSKDPPSDSPPPSADPALAPAAATSPGTAKPKESGGPKGLEPTRYGDWERNGRCIDF